MYECVGSYQTNMVNEMLATIVSIQPKDSGGSGGETRESVVYRLADDVLGKLPADYVQHEVGLQHTHTAMYCIGQLSPLPCMGAFGVNDDGDNNNNFRWWVYNVYDSSLQLDSSQSAWS